MQSNKRLHDLILRVINEINKVSPDIKDNRRWQNLLLVKERISKHKQEGYLALVKDILKLYKRLKIGDY